MFKRIIRRIFKRWIHKSSPRPSESRFLYLSKTKTIKKKFPKILVHTLPPSPLTTESLIVHFLLAKCVKALECSVWLFPQHIAYTSPLYLVNCCLSSQGSAHSYSPVGSLSQLPWRANLPLHHIFICISLHFSTYQNIWNYLFSCVFATKQSALPRES